LAIQKKLQTRKEQILQAAERAFAQKGYQEATISDVAREAKVSEATIYEYFTSKEELLFSLPGETARRGRENLEYILQFIRGTADQVRAFIYHHLNFYQNNPDYASVAMLILKQNRKFLEMQAYQDVQELSRVIIRIIQEGIAKGEFKSDINPYLVRSTILGAIEHLVIRQVLLGKPENLIAMVDPLTDLILGGIKAPEEEKAWHFQVNLGAEKKKATGRRPPSEKSRKTI